MTTIDCRQNQDEGDVVLYVLGRMQLQLTTQNPEKVLYQTKTWRLERNVSVAYWRTPGRKACHVMASRGATGLSQQYEVESITLDRIEGTEMTRVGLVLSNGLHLMGDVRGLDVSLGNVKKAMACGERLPTAGY